MKYWKAKNVNGRKVYQKDDLFDPHRVDTDGLTNIQRMKAENAPIGNDGLEMNLHHLTQDEPGAIARERFLKSLTKDAAALSKWSADAVAKMSRGKLPANMVIHHKKPLFRGGKHRQPDQGKITVCRRHKDAKRDVLHVISISL